jgi:hypothetical protein
MNVLEGRMLRGLKELDIEREPRRVADGARLLADVQDWVHQGARLEGLVASFLNGGTAPIGPKSLADWAYEVLSENDGPMPYGEIAAAVRARGFKHAREPKNPDRQLKDSIWSAMYEDDRFTKVGRGIFDLSERL